MSVKEKPTPISDRIATRRNMPENHPELPPIGRPGLNATRHLEESMKPLIGITPSPSNDQMSHGMFYRYCLSRTYVDSVRAAGGVPVILPTDATELDDLFPRLDGLLLSGGGDLDPAHFGEPELHEATYGIDAQRDAFELRAFREAVDRDLPTLCICRGIQVMAVAMGGTLVQDISSTLPDVIEHRQSKLGKNRDDVGHEVTLSDGNPLADRVRSERFAVNSFHHQAVKDPGATLVVIAAAEDDVIEGLWHPGMHFGIGVQWHPEMLAGSFAQHAAIFDGFVDAARQPAPIP
jgi:putative glutamine amidotransferase